MAVKTFTTGEVLTASDTNTYLANAGLVYVTTATFSGSTEVQINNCFSTTYDRYRIHLDFYGSASTYANLKMRVSGANATNNYYKTGFTTRYNTAAVTVYNGTNEASLIPVAQYGTTSANSCGSTLEIIYPFSARNTQFQVLAYDPAAIEQYNLYAIHAQALSYDGFAVIPQTGTITGNIRIYGYRTN